MVEFYTKQCSKEITKFKIIYKVIPREVLVKTEPTIKEGVDFNKICLQAYKKEKLNKRKKLVIKTISNEINEQINFAFKKLTNDFYSLDVVANYIKTVMQQSKSDKERSHVELDNNLNDFICEYTSSIKKLYKEFDNNEFKLNEYFKRFLQEYELYIKKLIDILKGLNIIVELEVKQTNVNNKVELSKEELEEIYNNAIISFETCNSHSGFATLIKTFKQLGDYKESKVYLDKCEELIVPFTKKKTLRLIITILSSVFACSLVIFVLSYFIFKPIMAKELFVESLENGDFEQAYNSMIELEKNYNVEDFKTIIDDYDVTICINDNATFNDSYYTQVVEKLNYYIPKVKISNNVTIIPHNAFYNCESLTSITIPNSVTSIGDGAFSLCTSLTSIEIPNSVTSIGDYAFYYCTSIISIEIPNSVTSIGEGAFAGCYSLTIYCEAESTPSGWNSSWSYSNSIVWGYNYVKVDGVVYGIKDGVATVIRQPINITTANIPSIVTYKGITYNVTSIGNSAFDGCTSLASIEIPNSVTSIGSEAFRDCTSLTSIEIPDSVTSIGYFAFYNCISLTSINVDEDNTVYSSLDGNLYNKNKTTLIQYAIGKQATSFTIPNSVTSIGNGAFQYCKSLTSIEIPNSVTSIGDRAFSDCNSLTSIEIPNTVTSIGNYAFRNCISLTSIEIPNTVTSIGDYAFRDCTSLTIYCEATSKPNGWDSNWNYSSGPVYWYSESEPTSSGNYWHYVDGVATKW